MSARIVIIGAGIAGLSTALRLAPLPVTVLTGAPLGEGSASAWAQGGIAAALSEDDAPEFHADDTMKAGAGLVDMERAAQLAGAAAAQIAWLEQCGVPFDRLAGGGLALGREAAHGHNRIVHAGGDGTGAAVMRALIAAARATPSITFRAGRRARKLEVRDGCVIGVHSVMGDEPEFWPADAVILATGGIGQLYYYTTNPGAACGEGLAMAALAGARCADLEFVQFHPTALAIGRDPMPLLTEALRGDGAVLINETGERFMPGAHPLAELAPRDVVARAIWSQLQQGHRPMLDARKAIGAHFPEKFPLIYAVCQSAGLDPVTEPLPIAPAAHYHMGGVVVDAHGRSSLKGLWACGEVASTGIHGANRLASNSLLEALVYASLIAEDITEHPPGEGTSSVKPAPFFPEVANAQDAAVKNDVRKLMVDAMGLVREEQGMLRALKNLVECSQGAALLFSTQAMILVATMMTASALQRKESRGAHYRSDYPQTNAKAEHSTVVLSEVQDALFHMTGKKLYTPFVFQE